MLDNKKYSFVWYHAKRTDEPQIRAWLDVVQQAFAVDTRLYVREDMKHVTFMEVFSGISLETNLAIENLSTQQELFKPMNSAPINRHCEIFEDIRGKNGK